MKATELISRLAKLIEEHGDLEVIATNPYCEPCGADVKSVCLYASHGYLEKDDYDVPVFEIYGE